ncbi:hypothetical protein DMC25_21705 [Caulobacter sp. D4A]|uniref:hypothetical protein n=1 Tax=unclassified Caulobacter TaxID=2648921 RepID=UPI000D73A67E|nr:MULTISPECIES: hypothetical protein [unclassified Caulobacter]PXA79493.1 hypothetical protein DMC25_21705 [Caulobacter sp. D4A]PXA88762.1 hypothetical protein DMC18_18550 [Caulobacter sp. D5]
MAFKRAFPWIVTAVVMAATFAVAGGLTIRRDRAEAARSAAASPDVTVSQAEDDRAYARLLRENLDQGRPEEASVLAQFPDLARREGDALFVRGPRGPRGDVASFSDSGFCDGFDQCARWRMAGVVTVGGERLPHLTFTHGEGELLSLLIGADGRPRVADVGTPSGSPDGAWLVFGNESDDGGGVTVYRADGADLVPTASKGASCRPQSWQDATRLRMSCLVGPIGEARRVEVILARAKDGGWSLIYPDGKREPLDAIATEDGEPGDFYEGWSEKGYRRLAS